MGKYASGTSMKTVIKSEVKEVTGILKKSNLSKADQNAALDALKEMAYQWCMANASACAMERAALETLGEDRYTDLVKTAITSGVQEETMKKTWPY